MNDRVRFGYHDISDLGTFGSGQSLFFSEGHMLVAGENGAGKTTICSAQVAVIFFEVTDYSLYPVSSF